MFNPQRKSKPVDIYMEEKSFQFHLQRLHNIRKSSQPRALRLEDQASQRRYLSRLHLSKQQVKGRLKSDIDKNNHKLMSKLIETDRRPDAHAQKRQKKKHFNSYFNNRREEDRIRQENTTMLSRMVQKQPVVPPLSDMKKDFKQSKRYSKMMRKLPNILKHEETYKRDLSSRRLHESKTSLRSSRRRSVGGRSTSNLNEGVEQIEKQLTAR